MKLSAKAIVGLCLGALAAAVAWGLSYLAIVERLELLAFDARARAMATAATDDRAKIRLILIDNDSLQWAYEENGLPWPWPRDVYTYILDYCAKAGVRAFVFDALFVHGSHQAVVAHDEALGESVARLPRFVTPLMPRQATEPWSWPTDVPKPDLEVTWDDGGRVEPIAFSAAELPIPEVMQPTTMLGHAFGRQDLDGRFRRLPLLIRCAGVTTPVMPLSLVAAEASGPVVVRRGGLVVGDRTVPIDARCRAVLRFRQLASSGQAYPAYSARAIIQSALLESEGGTPPVPLADLKDAVVFFGASATALYDLQPTPIDPRGSGVSLHATAFDNLVHESFIAAASPVAAGLAALALAMAAAALAAMSRSVLEIGLVALAALPMPTAIGFAAYGANVWWPVASPTLAVLLAWVGGLAFNYATEGRQRRFLRRAFAQYVSPVVVDRITREPGQLQLGGELRTLTMFFSDVEGFSTLAHDLGPAQITGLLNTYLSDMVSILFDENGTLDKYEGDAIIAFWNAPVDQPDHALRACRAALRCQRRLREREAFYRGLAGGRTLRMRIGIHTGEVVVGNMGSAERFDYSMLGEAANLASRLEGANKQLGTRLLISDATWGGLGGRLPGREVGAITVVGGAVPLTVYELLAEGDASSPRCVEYALALAEARRGEFAAALARLDRSHEDPAAAAFAGYLRQLQGPWDGIRHLHAK